MKELFAAMAKAFPDIEGATKDKTNPAFKSKYADLGSVVDAIKPALVKHGLFFSQLTHDAADGVCVETIVCHASGEQMSFGRLHVPATKRDAQGYGSALTYARRYSLMAAFGVPAEDDDGNAAERRPPANDGAKISDVQVRALQDLASEVGADLQKFCEYFKIDNLPGLPAYEYDRAVSAMEKRRKVAA